MPELTQGRAITLTLDGETLTVRGGRLATRTYSTSATLDLTLDEGAYVVVTGAATITLPPSAPSGWSCTIRHAAGTSAVALAPGSGVTIDAPYDFTTLMPDRAVKVTSNGSDTYYVDGEGSLDPYTMTFPAAGEALIAITRAETIALGSVTSKEADGTAGTGTLTYKKNGTTVSGTTAFAVGDVLTVALASSTTPTAVSIPRYAR